MLPQKTINIVVKSKDEALSNPKLQALCKQIEKELGKDGRILLRASGTEPKIRIMLECASKARCEGYVNSIMNLVKEEGLEWKD